MIETIETGTPKVVGFKLHGILHDEDYKQFVPTMETILTAEGKVRMFVQFEDFHGWDPHAAWDELKFGLRHYSDFERIAMVGDRRWERWMAAFCRPFTKAKVKYFDESEAEAAWEWLRKEEEPPRAEEEKATEEEKPAVWNEYFGAWF